MTKPLSLTFLAASAGAAALTLAALAAVPPPLPVHGSTPALVALTAPIAPVPVTVVLLFDYPTNEVDTNIVFILHGTTNATTPIQQWPVDATLSVAPFWSNGVVNVPIQGDHFVFSVSQPTLPGIKFWYVTASNFWGESFPSNVLAMPPAPRSDVNLRAIRQ